MEGGREGGREGDRQGGREGGRDGEREGRREGGTEAGREGRAERRREGEGGERVRERDNLGHRSVSSKVQDPETNHSQTNFYQYFL